MAALMTHRRWTQIGIHSSSAAATAAAAICSSRHSSTGTTQSSTSSTDRRLILGAVLWCVIDTFLVAIVAAVGAPHSRFDNAPKNVRTIIATSRRRLKQTNKE